MAPLRRKHGAARAAPREEWTPRKGRARESPARLDDRYGSRRLRALYEISKLLGQFTETPEATVMAFLAVMNRELPLRSAVLVERLTDRPKTIAWHAPAVNANELRLSEALALRTFQALTGTEAPVQLIETKTNLLAPRRPETVMSSRPQRGKFITCPLVVQGKPIFGALHLEGFALFDEEDIEFANAIASQLAVALDRNQVRLTEIVLRKNAEELNAFKTSLVSVVSHEFGNSLTVMKIAVSLLEKNMASKGREANGQLLGMITSNIDLLNRAVQNLLNMGRLEAGKLAIDFKPTDAAEILKSVFKGLQLLCEQKSLRASLAIPAGLRPVRADPASLILVVSNLLSNAIKYTPAGGRIVLGVLREKARPGQYRVYVQDSGIGVAPDDRAKILAGHFRSEVGKKMTSKGFGVGLSLAQQIVEAHGSTIEIEDADGQGSRFSFLLPIAAEKDAKSP